MGHLRGVPAAVRLHANAAWFCASIAYELISDRIHHRTRPWPTQDNQQGG